MGIEIRPAIGGDASAIAEAHIAAWGTGLADALIARCHAALALRFDDALLWVLTDKIPIVDETGAVTGIIVFAIDITKRKQAQDDLEKRSEELRTMNNAMAGRENRMVELKKTTKKLRAQLEEAGMTPVADDPLMSESNLDPGHISIEAEDGIST